MGRFPNLTLLFVVAFGAVAPSSSTHASPKCRYLLEGVPHAGFVRTPARMPPASRTLFESLRKKGFDTSVAKRIATSYPNETAELLKNENFSSPIRSYRGLQLRQPSDLVVDRFQSSQFGSTIYTSTYLHEAAGYGNVLIEFEWPGAFLVLDEWGPVYELLSDLEKPERMKAKARREWLATKEREIREGKWITDPRLFEYSSDRGVYFLADFESFPNISPFIRRVGIRTSLDEKRAVIYWQKYDDAVSKGYLFGNTEFETSITTKEVIAIPNGR